MAWNFDSHTPVYLQIAKRLRNQILGGVYKQEEQFPSVRQLAMTAAVNPNTMQRALSELETEGLLYSKGTQGRFVTGDSQVLLAARSNAAKELVADFVKQASYMSITKNELIKMLEEEEL